MYERLLDKTLMPSFKDLLEYSDTCSGLWVELDDYLKSNYSAQQQVRFPYGNKYGWSTKYSLKKRHICDVFAENGAFAIHFRISNDCLNSIYSGLSDYSKNICDEKYPCGEGGWLTYRVLSKEHLNDAIKILSAKINMSILKSRDKA